MRKTTLRAQIEEIREKLSVRKEKVRERRKSIGHVEPFIFEDP
jgi:hypothetical protein